MSRDPLMSRDREGAVLSEFFLVLSEGIPPTMSFS